MLKLGYTVEEVDMMRIEIAQKLLAAKTKRPFGKRSMPESWKKTGGGRPKRKKTSASAFLCRAALFPLQRCVIDVLTFDAMYSQRLSHG